MLAGKASQPAVTQHHTCMGLLPQHRQVVPWGLLRQVHPSQQSFPKCSTLQAEDVSITECRRIKGKRLQSTDVYLATTIHHTSSPVHADP